MAAFTQHSYMCEPGWRALHANTCLKPRQGLSCESDLAARRDNFGMGCRLQTTRRYARNVTAVNPCWLLELAPQLFRSMPGPTANGHAL